MKHEPVAGVHPEIFRWARQTIGLSVDDVARILKRSSDEIESWELGNKAPSYAQLEKLAYQVYKRPLAIFFLPAPPDEITPKREFRTLPESDLQTLLPDTYLQIRRAHAYQIALNELFNGRNPVDQPIWQMLALTLSEPIALQANTIRSLLGVDIESQLTWFSDEVSLKNWRKKIEEAGVFVFKNSFKQKEISGFCLRDYNLPIIYLNNTTTKTRQIFSLLHELAHLLMDMNGLSKFDTDYIDRLPNQEKEIERFCNAIAAEVLIPSIDFLEQTNHLPFDVDNISDENFSNLANRYGVSREAILRRFLDQGRVNKVIYEQKAKFWGSQKKSGGSGNWYASQNVYLSNRFASEVIGRYYRQQLTIDQAADFLGVKVKNFEGLEQRILQGVGA